VSNNIAEYARDGMTSAFRVPNRRNTACGRKTADTKLQNAPLRLKRSSGYCLLNNG
jgi:hypothetical protein